MATSRLPIDAIHVSKYDLFEDEECRNRMFFLKEACSVYLEVSKEDLQVLVIELSTDAVSTTKIIELKKAITEERKMKENEELKRKEEN
ncbi:hypothetical protein CDAR_606101 [Caerostris darwini]|uniref:Uncharacterized protein n=1 Tax=Caerostris darwini TaxID=1538125 RepID=A0AAV4NUJ6_9ARAC|nr:hypothetical protein CDAR_606101 [Caerostris darwini]